MAFIIWWQKADMERIREYLLLAPNALSRFDIASPEAAPEKRIAPRDAQTAWSMLSVFPQQA